ncbi:LysM peptidoglycan-binding domain-containing protein [Rhodococcus yananensis]|uniref:LysM peptidoglycan-binding domain-containing protein n=1 Tax=Rhodococcus yananensis TaxID=2879464 RepID=UPI001CF8FD9A|nr:LysM peptidoglycan-binding domain-containing protein [Rhodococcus yananensis]
MKTYEVQAGDTLFGIARREYGDGTLYPVIARQNHLADPNVIDVGQQLLIPYVTFRHRMHATDSIGTRKQITELHYGVTDSSTQLAWEIVNGVAQREIQRGAWLLMPELGDVGHHTVVAGETLAGLAARWYGDDHLALLIELANHLPDGTVTPGQVLIVPGLNRRHRVSGDTLESLCRFEYGDADVATRMAVVAAANRIAEPDALFSGQTLVFPS